MQVEIDAVELDIAENQKTTRELEGRAAEIDAATFDLKAVNPRAVIKRDDRTPEQIIQSIEDHAKIVSAAVTRLRGLLADAASDEANSHCTSKPESHLETQIPEPGALSAQ